MNKDEKEALRELYKYEMEVIENSLLKKAIENNTDYSSFEYAELKHILNCVKAKHDLFEKITYNIELLVGIFICAVVNFCTPLHMIMSFAVDVIIMTILWSVWRYACKSSFERVENFLRGKCELHRTDKLVNVGIDGFRPFTIELYNNK